MPRLARDFAFLVVPSFEGGAHLGSLRLRQYWMNWSGHATHVTVYDVICAFAETGYGEYLIQCVGLIPDSWRPSILPITAAHNQHEYTAEKHGPKPFHLFSEKVFTEVHALVRVPGGDEEAWKAARHRFHMGLHWIPQRLHELELRVRALEERR